jgi:vacuolar-type H+-ATPase subunit H
MKNVYKYLLIASCMTFALSVSAQEESAPKATLADFSVGDTIVIKKDHERYLTGEKMSKWVYNVEHTIQQVGGKKKWPNGILIRGIYSWVDPDDIVNKSKHPEEAAAHQEAKQQAEQERQDSVQQVKEEQRDSVREAREEAARQDSIARAQRAAAQQAYKDSVDKARQDSIANRAYRDSVAQATRDSLPKLGSSRKIVLKLRISLPRSRRRNSAATASLSDCAEVLHHSCRTPIRRWVTGMSDGM